MLHYAGSFEQGVKKHFDYRTQNSLSVWVCVCVENDRIIFLWWWTLHSAKCNIVTQWNIKKELRRHEHILLAAANKSWFCVYLIRILSRYSIYSWMCSWFSCRIRLLSDLLVALTRRSGVQLKAGNSTLVAGNHSPRTFTGRILFGTIMTCSTLWLAFFRWLGNIHGSESCQFSK